MCVQWTSSNRTTANANVKATFTSNSVINLLTDPVCFEWNFSDLSHFTAVYLTWTVPHKIPWMRKIALTMCACLFKPCLHIYEVKELECNHELYPQTATNLPGFFLSNSFGSLAERIFLLLLLHSWNRLRGSIVKIYHQLQFFSLFRLQVSQVCKFFRKSI